MVRKLPVLVAAVAVAGGVAIAVPATATATTRTAIPNSHPAWAKPQARVAASASGARLTLRVYLRMRDAAGATATAKAVSDPHSASYRKYLTPAQVRSRYAAGDATVRSVGAWLRSSGLSTGAVPSNNAYVEATGTVAKVQSAFGVHLGQYRVHGKTLRAADTDLSVPSTIGASVLGIVGANQSMSRPMHTTGTATSAAATPTAAKPGDVPPPAGFRNSQPCGAYYGEKVDTTDPAYGGKQLPYAPCGYKPGQLRSAYGISSAVDHGVDGSGVTVAIVDAFASPTLYADAATYARRNDPGHPLTAAQYSQHVFPTNPALEPPDQCDAAGWYGEQTLDVEAVHAMAPGAHILYVGGSDCLDTSLDQALNYIVAGHKADIVSNSYGNLGEDIAADEVAAFNQIAVQAVLEGIGVYFSSGDSGDEVANLGTPSPDFSASDPWVTAVGGTSIGIGRTGKRVVETGWETGRSALTNGAWTPGPPGTYLYGAGGGTSRLFTQPAYQRGVVPNSLAKQNQTGGRLGRVVPDISAVGDPNTGFLVGETQTFSDGVYYGQFRIGGTSLSSPVFAGIMAVADNLDHYHHGFVNPLLYQFTSRTKAVKDIRHANGGVVRVDYANGENASDGLLTTVRSFDYPNLTIHTTNGYDNVTGLGVPDGLLFLLLA